MKGIAGVLYFASGHIVWPAIHISPFEPERISADDYGERHPRGSAEYGSELPIAEQRRCNTRFRARYVPERVAHEDMPVVVGAPSPAVGLLEKQRRDKTVLELIASGCLGAFVDALAPGVRSLCLKPVTHRLN